MNRGRQKKVAGATRLKAAEHDALLVRCPDGRVFNFDEFKNLIGLVGPVVEALRHSLSTNEEIDVRAQTNRSYFDRLTAFLRWASRQRNSQGITLCTLTLQRYRRSLLASDLAPATAFHYYQSALNVARVAMASGRAAPFLLPPNLSGREALAAGKGSRTLVDLLDQLPPGMTPETANVELLRMLLLACDRRAREFEARLELGARWRAEVAAGEFMPPTMLLDQPFGEWKLSRDALLEVATKLVLKLWGGHVPRSEAVASCDSREARLLSAILLTKAAGALRRAGMRQIGRREIRSYLVPTTDYFAALVPIFAASGVNPHSIRRLRVDQLVVEADEPGKFASIVFNKPRAGGDVRVGPFRIGEPGALSLPQVWARVVKATSHSRKEASPSCRNLLLIGGRNKWRAEWGPQIRAPRACALVRIALQPWLVQCEGKEAPLRGMAPRLSAKVVRTTAINIAYERLKRDSEQSAMLFGHQPRVLDLTYILSARVRDDLERTMRDGQGLLEAWLREPISVVPNRASAIRKVGRVDSATAEAIRRGELADLSGVCLLHERALVVETATNCLRMYQWLARLRSAEPRMKREQPGRWLARYAPQIPLFEDALNDFSRRTRRQAEVLSKTILLPMPEIA